MVWQGKQGGEASRLDDAARAGWLYYVAGNTQDQIARKLGVSRQSAQRLVSLAVAEQLIRVRVDHPIARCMELGAAIVDRYGIDHCEVVPSDPEAPHLLTGVAVAGAVAMERYLKLPEPQILALGTGRSLRAAVEQLPMMECPQHRIVSRLGNMMSDGSATPYNVVIRMAERVGARHYPMPLPVWARDEAERAVLHSQEPVANSLRLCREADVSFVGIGQMDATAPLVLDGFLSVEETQALAKSDVVGEITSWIYDSEGRIVDTDSPRRVLSAPLEKAGDKPVIGIGSGPGKVPAIRGALKGRLINQLITNEATAEMVLEQ